MTIDQDKQPAECTRCNWLGTLAQTVEACCPVCGAAVNQLGQKGLDSLRRHYRVMMKPDCQRRYTGEQLEQFFEMVREPLREHR